VRERTVVPWVGAGASCKIFPLWERLLRDLWVANSQKKGKKELSLLIDAFNKFFVDELQRDAPLLTDLLGTHCEVCRAFILFLFCLGLVFPAADMIFWFVTKGCGWHCCQLSRVCQRILHQARA
jgi:hypothetical protein